ncbi:MAG: PhoH family protein [Bacteroidia bacterium]|nr:PhoH family protein [Bacteroidia bacterium]
MIEKEITLDVNDPVLFFGVNNANFELLEKYFSRLKLVARGNIIKITGEASEISKFEEKIKLLQDYINKYNSLSKDYFIKFLADDNGNFFNNVQGDESVLIYNTNGKPIKPKTRNQHRMVKCYKTHDLLFAIGPAGTGKTYIAIALAIRALKNREINRIFLSRPAVEAGERLGFLPGDMKDKLDPYLQPLYDALIEMIPPKKLENLFEDGVIQIAPLAFMRGRTLNNAFVILDEAQNSTVSQLKMFLTRMGENCKFIVTGDITQIDLPDRNHSGLVISRRILQHIEGIAFIDFDQDDIVRHRLVRYIVDAYQKAENEKI